MSTVNFPHFGDKHSGSPLLQATNTIARLRERLDPVVPEAVIMGYSSSMLQLATERDFVEVPGYSSYWNLWLRTDDRADQVGIVAGFGIGPSIAALVVEELAALGVKRFISLGAAGALPSSINIFDTVLCTSALRDEGVSHHYLPSARFATPTKSLTEQLRAALVASGKPFHEGSTWTLDAIYRETVEEATAYRDEGILAVDMEAATVFTVGQVLGVETASAFWVSDHLLANPEWTLAPNSNDRIIALAHIVDAALSILETPVLQN